MGWSVSELDKNKTEQSISNEEIRLDNCRAVVDKIKKEYEHKKYMFMVELSNLEDKITALETSITSGEKFIEECKEHLKDFD